MTTLTCDLIFTDIDPEEVRTLTFSFTNGLGDDTITDATLEVSSDGGDPAPSTRFSSPQVQGVEVLVVAFDCQPGNTYHLRVIAPTSNPDKRLVLGADITCRTF